MRAAELDQLRRTLAEATSWAERLGDEPTAVSGRGYLASAELRDAIDRVASARDPITLVAGAGVSMEAGLPSWSTLVERLLEPLAEQDAPQLQRRWLKAVMDEGPLAAAAVAETHVMNEDFQVDPVKWRQRIRDALYQGSSRAYVPGALAQQVALLKKRFPNEVQILTANYDGLLEAALLEVLADDEREVVSYVRGEPEPEAAAAVWHIHGRLMLRFGSTNQWQRTGRIVLSEASYSKVPHGSFPETFMGQHLRERLCVFVGLSMTDPNLIRWLYRYGDPAYRHIAIFVRQGSGPDEPGVREKLERTTRLRWRRCGVESYFAEYYGEVAQLLHEAGIARAGIEVPEFRARATERHNALISALAPADSDSFHVAQQKASAWLRERLEGVRQIAAAGKAPLDDERLGLALWSVDHEAGQVTLLAAHDRIFSDAAVLESRPLEPNSPWIAVAAVTNGVAVEQDPAIYTSRWRAIRGIPVIVETQGEGRTVSGVLTLTSTKPLPDSKLASKNAPPGVLHEVDSFLASSAAKWFS